MDKSMRVGRKFAFTKLKLPWILVTLFLCSIYGAGTYFDLKNNITSNELVMNIHPERPKEENLIWYNKSNASSLMKWVLLLNEFTQVYKLPQYTPNRAENAVACNYSTLRLKDKVCDIKIDSWSPCTSEKKFNYQEHPCIFLEIVKDRYWNLTTFNSISELPNNMPQSLVDHIKKVVSNNSQAIKTVWISCDGKYPADKENIGEIKYFPTRGIPEYYFYNDKGEGYIHPTIAVELIGLQTGIIIQIECQFWASNFQGTSSFEILIDD